MLPKDSLPGAELEQSTSLSPKILDLSVIIPTRNEVGNIKPLLTRIDQALSGIRAEVLFVDDSTDETPQMIKSAIPLFPDLTIRLFHRAAEKRIGVWEVPFYSVCRIHVQSMPALWMEISNIHPNSFQPFCEPLWKRMSIWSELPAASKTAR